MEDTCGICDTTSRKTIVYGSPADTVYLLMAPDRGAMQYQRRQIDYISDEAKQAAARSPVVRGTRIAFAVVSVAMFASMAAWFMLAVAGSELQYVAQAAMALCACGALGIQFFSLWWLVNR